MSTRLAHIRDLSAQLQVWVQKCWNPGQQADDSHHDSDDSEDQACQRHPFTLQLPAGVSDLSARYGTERHRKDGKNHRAAQHQSKNPAYQRRNSHTAVLWGCHRAWPSRRYRRRSLRRFRRGWRLTHNQDQSLKSLVFTPTTAVLF